ncbi:MAG: ArsA family ATPase [Deltaproteobacteria bacterium]|nr:ArsA family ATPase [Deltaproteobacteria bacterium]
MSLFNEFLSRRIWFVTGKGGVGKTMLAAALGNFASQFVKVLLVEINSCTHLGNLLGNTQVGYHETPLKKNLSLIQLNPQDCFHEYVLKYVRFETLYKGIFDHRFVRHFMEGTPGLNELLTIGKIWDLAEGEKKYDLVIVDGPATGHSLAMLSVPDTVDHAVRMGPLKNKAHSIVKLIKDPTKMAVWIVTLCEEMPVNETIDLFQELKKINIPIGPILANRMWPNFFIEAESQKLKPFQTDNPILRHYFSRLDLNQTYFDQLKSFFKKHPLVPIPHLWKPETDAQILQQITAYCQEL